MSSHEQQFNVINGVRVKRSRAVILARDYDAGQSLNARQFFLLCLAILSRHNLTGNCLV